jgi:hypothetical protein
MARSTKLGFVLLVVGIIAGAAGAQAYQTFQLSRFLKSGLFTLADGETVFYNVTLDDSAGTPPATVLMQLLDPRGAVAARQIVTLGPGQSSTLRFSRPGAYRAYSEVTDLGPFTARRSLVSTVEIFGPNKDLGLGIPRTYVCSSSSDGTGNGRLPD